MRQRKISDCRYGMINKLCKRNGSKYKTVTIDAERSEERMRQKVFKKILRRFLLDKCFYSMNDFF